MRGTPNEFFAFLPDHEKTAAIQASDIIRRCDDTLRFEAMIGSWLISRLISILRIDSTVVTYPSSGNGTDGNGSASNVKGSASTHTSPTSLGSGDQTIPKISCDKPLFMYVGHLESSGAAMNGFATHLAGIISTFSISNGNSSATVASTISYCLNLLENSKEKKVLLDGLCKIIIGSHQSLKSIADRIKIPPKAREDLKRILTTALCCILLQVKTSAEALQDFDYIWEACRDQASHVSSVFDDNQISKECSWLLSIGAYLSEESLSQSLSHSDRRKVRMLMSGACIAVVAQSALWLKPQNNLAGLEDNEHENYNKLPAMKRQRLNRDECTAMTENNPKFICKDFTSRIALEKNAIKQLCSLGNKSEASDPISTKDEKENSTSRTTNETKEQSGNPSQLHNTGKEKGSTSILDTVVSAINDLSFKESSITASELEKVLLKAVTVAAVMNLLIKDDKLESSLKESEPIQSMFSTHHGRVSSVAILGKFCRVLIGSSQNSYSPNGPSIFTGFSFVNETLLVAEKTSYVRLYLIDLNERKSAEGTIEHVAAEVLFYKSKKEKIIDISNNNDDDTEADISCEKRSAKRRNYSEISKALELNEWSDMLLESSSKRIKPSTKLLYFIGSSNNSKSFTSNRDTVGNIMIPILNQALARLKQADKNSNHDKLEVDEAGGMTPQKNTTSSSRICIQAKNMGRALLTLYYKSLESILNYETARLKTSSHRNLLLSVSFHKALLSICLFCVVHATSGAPSANFENDKDTDKGTSYLFVQSLLKLMDCTAHEYMKISEPFIRSMVCSSNNLLDSNSIQGLPAIIKRKLLETEEQILESLLWVRDNEVERTRNTIGVIEDLLLIVNNKPGHDSLWPPKVLESIAGQESPHATPRPHRHGLKGDESSNPEDVSMRNTRLCASTYLNYLITKVLSIMSKRVAMICAHLGIPPHHQVTKQIWYTFRELLRSKVQLLCDRHLDQLILCTIYGVCKALKYEPNLTFSRIVEVYMYCFEGRVGGKGTHTLLRNVKLDGNHEGTVIDLYNQIFLPSMKKVISYISNVAVEGKDNDVINNDLLKSNTTVPRWKKSSNGVMLQDSNFHLKFTNNQYGEESNRRKETPKSRVLYSFGDSKGIDLINKTINCT